MSGHFAFLEPEWPGVFEAAGKAEAAAHADPRTACFYARRALELAVAWAFKHVGAKKQQSRLNTRLSFGSVSP